VIFGRKAVKKEEAIRAEMQVQRAELSRELSETRSLLSSVLTRLSRIDEALSQISSKLTSLERMLEGNFIIQLTGIPASLEELARLIDIRGAVLLKSGREVERFGEIKLDYTAVLSSVNFTSFLSFDIEDRFVYVLRDGDKVLYLESGRPLDPYVLAYLRKYLRFA